MSDDCKDFITNCLKKSPAERLGTLNGVNDIINHPWFSDVDSQKLLSKQYDMEFKPKLSKDILDVSNFDKMFTSDEAAHSVLPI